MENRENDKTPGPASSFEVKYFRPEDADGIVRLFKAVYGNGYPIRLFYDAQALTKANAEGEYLSVILRNAAGEVVGVENLFRSAPYTGLYEVGAGLVLQKYRQLGLNNRLMSFVYEEWVPKQKGIEELLGEPVCNHTHMQKAVVTFDHVEMALEAALMPAEAYDKERSASGRVAALLVFRSYVPKPHTVFMPRSYEKELRHLYSRLDDRRELRISADPLPEGVTSEANMTVFAFARVARIAVHQSGADFAELIRKLETEAVSQKAVVIQVWVKLTDPWVGSAVEVLRNRGYFFGGPLPRWFDGDGFLMQKILCDPDFEGIRLHSDHARGILEIVKHDWSRAQATAATSIR